MTNPEAIQLIDHRYLDEQFTKNRRMLWTDKVWRQGPERAYDVSSQIISAFKKYKTNFHESYMEMGCGVYSPLGVSTVMYLNGIENCIAIDKHGTDRTRSAEALYDLLAACALEPKRWNMTGQKQTEYFKRLHAFNIGALQNGNLSKGVANTPLVYMYSNLESVPIADNTMMFISSRATLEHIMDFRQGMKELYRIMKPRGVSLHSIDLVDHRIYREPEKYNMWSFLQKGDICSDSLCNRLRAHEILEIAKDVGFDIDVLETESHEIRSEILNSFDDIYASMNIDDLKTTSITCIFRK